MSSIEVTPIGPGRYGVDVTDGGATTSHEVTVPAGLIDRLGTASGGTVAEADLVRESFAFLLEHEPASAILERFSLSVIATYFPDYEQQVARRLS